MFKRQIEGDLKKVVEDLGYESPDLVLSIPKNLGFGDYTSNIALQLANQKSDKGQQSPKKIANKIVARIKNLESSKDYLEKVEIAGPGFINFFLKDETLLLNIPKVCNYSAFVNPEVELDLQKRKVFMEYAQPNSHKLFHIGHTRNISLGESISRLLESQGNEVYRSTYGSDIGLPVAKAIWGIQSLEEEYKKVKKSSLDEKVSFLGKAYAKGAKAYGEDEESKKIIDELNIEIYKRDKKIMPIWEETKQWSAEYLEGMFQKLGTKFDRAFWESEVEGLGSEIVRNNIGKIFEKDQGAVIFPGEKYGLHNRVFLTAAGNPTYEAKDLRLAQFKQEIWPFDLGLILSGSEQAEYFKVMFKALEMIDDSFAGKMMNFSFGMVNLPSGKMSSRTGEVVTFDWLYEQVRDRVGKIMKDHSKLKGDEKDSVIDTVSIGAIKFSMLKYSPQTDITFDIEKSVSLDGDSGPYLQYTYARAKSVLRTASYNYAPGAEAKDLETEERTLLQKIEHFEVVLEESAKNYSPNTLAEYLLDFARSFNLFYQKHQIIKAEEKMELRLALTCATAVVLKQGLYLLGIEAPERM